MTNQDIAINIYKEIKNINPSELKILKMLELVNNPGASIKEIVEFYEKIVKGELLIIDIVSRIELDQNQKENLEGKIKEEIKQDLAFNYEIKSNISRPLIVRINDKEAEFII